jgi:hypothetical protein
MISFGAAFPTFYRLVGPYRSSQAEKIVKTELWDTIKRRGVIGNIFMGVIPMVRYFSSSLIFGMLADGRHSTLWSTLLLMLLRDFGRFLRPSLDLG